MAHLPSTAQICHLASNVASNGAMPSSHTLVMHSPPEQIRGRFVFTCHLGAAGFSTSCSSSRDLAFDYVSPSDLQKRTKERGAPLQTSASLYKLRDDGVAAQGAGKKELCVLITGLPEVCCVAASELLWPLLSKVPTSLDALFFFFCMVNSADLHSAGPTSQKQLWPEDVTHFPTGCET